MPGNWNQAQNLNPDTYQVEWPSGPLPVAQTETPKYLEAWVVQRSSGASQRTAQTHFGSPGSDWNADENPWKQGNFQPGWALGIALVALRNTATNKDEFYWWIDEINLVLSFTK